ncbi:prepilin-type N-terminal cleavage/methylation domain-containing protein [Zavarzinia sp. CC-PAN008]|uniref:prepilin-type N-terminal cleavage/methylation domain-containing protein n=1 Tax=Zavarzinia sp. CC-PAN008 TaxID=3243332 RepID=UPI003F745A87
MARPAAAHPGFTLLEVLLTLALLAGLAGLVLPNAARMYDGAVLALGRGEVERQLARLPLAASLDGTDYTLAQLPGQVPPPGQPAIALRLEPGWRVEADPPIRYRNDGVCSGGRLTLWRGEARADYALDPPFCRPRRLVAQ